MLSPRYRDDRRPHLALNPTQLRARARHLEKLGSGEYRSESRPCPVCTGGTDVVLAEKDRYGLPMRVVVCDRCGLLRTEPRLDQASYASFYSEEYRDLYGGKESPDAAFFEDQVRHGKDILSRLPPLPAHALVVEVGCGAGGILQAFRLAGHEVIGCDLGESFLNYGRERHGLDLRLGFLRDLQLPRPPDVIIYSHVMEHILDLEAELRVVRQLLGPEGLLYVEIPSTKNIRKTYQWDFLRLLQSAHTYHFTLRSLTNVLSAGGFALVKGDEFVRAVFRPRDGKTPPVENDFADVTAFLRSTERWRYLHYLQPSVLFHPIKRLKKALRRRLRQT